VAIRGNTDCECLAGYYRTGTSSCTICPANKCKAAQGNGVEATTCLNCDANAVTVSGNTDCECNAGYYGTGTSSCTICPANKYKAAQGNGNEATTCLNCDANAVAISGDTGCGCNAGYDGTGTSSCAICPANKYDYKTAKRRAKIMKNNNSDNKADGKKEQEEELTTIGEKLRLKCDLDNFKLDTHKQLFKKGYCMFKKGYCMF